MDFLIQIDKQILLFINSLQNRFLDPLVLGINWATEGGLLWLILCFFIFLFDKKEKKRKIILILITLLLNSWLVNVPIKFVLFCRTRPFETIEGLRVIGKVWENCSFPSGHVAASVAALLIIAYLFKLRKNWFILSSILFILFLSFARIYVGMHYPTDVLAGLIIGLISVILVIWLDKQVKFS
jgi:undecaprenyl-diphosphatase